jgi:DegV family protein with EDD domain
MSRTIIITDSTAYLPDDLAHQYQIKVVPLTIIWDEKILLDGIDILPNDFYTRLANSKSMPTTSQVTTAEMESAFKRVLEEGNEILGIFLSSKLSGTVQSALQAREMLSKAKDKIAILDSQSTTMAMGWPVLIAARAAQQGQKLIECQKIAENACKHSGVMFVVETLEFLRRGGRIGGAQALLGSALNIKPVLKMQDGQIEPVERIRTKSKAVERLLDLIAESIGGKTPVRLATVHANAEAEALLLLDRAKKRFNPVESLCCPLSPAIGTHAGPGTVALTYLAGEV